MKKGPFHIEVSLDGVFEAQNQAELVVRPQEWPQMQVLKAVEHGTAVKQGDLVLALDTEKIDRTISDLRTDMQLNELGVKQSEAQLAALEKVAPLDEDANQRSERMTKEDWKLYQEVEKPLAVKDNEYRLKMYQENLEYAEEEYRQLEKMYKADDLKEETEKIVLRRAKNGVDRAKLMLEFAQAPYNETKKLSPAPAGREGQGANRPGLDRRGIHQGQVAVDNEQTPLGPGEAQGRADPGRGQTEQADFRPRGDDRQGADRWHRLLRPLRARQVGSHEHRYAPPRREIHAQRGRHDRGPDPAADHPHDRAGIAGPADPRRPAGLRRSRRLRRPEA